MSAKRTSLGRGLDALLGFGDEPEVTVSQGDREISIPADGRLAQLPVEFLQRGKYQPRRDLDPEALAELADSIRAQGVMQPIVVRPIGEDKYEIIAGERRWRATQQAGLDTIPAVIRDVPDEAAIAMALIENIQREDLNPIEESRALIRLQKEFELTQQQVAEAVGKSRPAVANLMRLMQLEPEVQKMLEHGDLELGHGKCLLALQGGTQIDAARSVAGRGMTVRQTEALVQKLLNGEPVTSKPQADNADIKVLEQELSEKLGAAVKIQHSASGKGTLTLKYNSVDELDGILAHIK